MWIALIILGILAAILLLPVSIRIRSDEDAPLSLQLQVLWLRFGTDLDAKDLITDSLLKKSGEKQPKQNAKKPGGDLGQTVSTGCDRLVSIVKNAVALLGHFVIKRLHIRIRCGGEDAAVTAIRYGQYNAIVHGTLSTLRNLVHVRKKGLNIDIGCNFSGKGSFRCHAVLSVRIFFVLSALWHLLLDEMSRKSK